jgi:hypothetical protein
MTASPELSVPGVSPLAKYEAACRALTEAVSVDEVMQIRDAAEMHAAAARIAGNRQLEMQAVELRMRGTRKLGEIITKQKESEGLNRGGRPASKTPSQTEGVSVPKLEELGITHRLSHQAQKLAAVPEREFEGLVETWRAESQAIDGRLTTDLLRVGSEQRQREARRDLQRTLSDASLELTGKRRYAAGYIDPPWLRKQGITDRSYENHYPTMTWAEIVAWAASVREHFLDDAWFFIWVPRAHAFALHPSNYTVKVDDGSLHTVVVWVPLPWAVARALGANAYSTCFVWTKTDEEHADDAGMGILVRDQDELLLMFKKGRGNAKPATNEVYTSNHRERSRPLGHSRKPQHYREMIARMVGGGVPVLECFARHDEQFPLPEAWDTWGNQAAPTLSAHGTP